MRKIQEILRLKWEQGLSHRQIAQSCAVARSTVADHLRRAQAAGLAWPLPDGMDEEQLEQRLFPNEHHSSRQTRSLPDWPTIHQELSQKGVTLALLWQEYKRRHPEGYQYSQFCERYRQWKNQLHPVMRQSHPAGEKMFVDYAGQTLPVTDAETGEVHDAQIFVAVLGASDYIYCEATRSQSLPDWLGSHVRALEFWGGCPALVIPDNLKSGVTHPCRYEPDLNPAYQEWAKHYQVTVLPTRVRKPRDKAKVENAVKLVEQWLLAPLRHQTFFHLVELNQALREQLRLLNQRPFRELPGCRESRFRDLEKPALKPLPTTPYEYAQWKKARVRRDYHIEVDRHYYSVPYRLIDRQVDVRLTAGTVECFCKGRRVCSHPRSSQAGGTSTSPEHMPKSHREYGDETPERILERAEQIGSQTREVTRRILRRCTHPLQGLRSGLGILRLAKKFGTDRLENACGRALRIGAFSYGSVRSILQKGLDHCPLPEAEPGATPIEHENIRGARYYH